MWNFPKHKEFLWLSIISQQHLLLKSLKRLKRHTQIFRSRTTIYRLVIRFRKTGSIHDKKRSGRPSVLNPDKLEEVKMLQSSTKSVRKLSSQSSLSYGSTHKAFKKLNLHPYRVRVNQELKASDMPKRLHCKWLREFIDRNGLKNLIMFFFFFRMKLGFISANIAKTHEYGVQIIRMFFRRDLYIH